MNQAFKNYSDAELAAYFEGTDYTFTRKANGTVGVFRRGGSLAKSEKSSRVRDSISRTHKRVLRLDSCGSLVTPVAPPPTFYRREYAPTPRPKVALIIGKHPPSDGGPLNGSTQKKIDYLCQCCGITSVVIMNLYPHVTSYGKFRSVHATPCTKNEDGLLNEAVKVDCVIAAWGTEKYFGKYDWLMRDRLLKQLRGTEIRLYCVDKHLNGRPIHINRWVTNAPLTLKRF